MGKKKHLAGQETRPEIPDMGLVQIPAPDKPVMSKAEVMAFLQIGEDLLDKMIKKGHFPRGYKLGEKAPWWSNAQIGAWLFNHHAMQPAEENSEET